jgi:hypothetical protein
VGYRRCYFYFVKLLYYLLNLKWWIYERKPTSPFKIYFSFYEVLVLLCEGKSMIQVFWEIINQHWILK